MLTKVDDYPEFIQQYIDEVLSSILDRETPILVQKADVGYRLRCRYTGLTIYHHAFFGEPLPGIENANKLFYINRDSLFVEEPSDEWSTVAYGFTDTCKYNVCDESVVKEELHSILEHKYSDLVQDRTNMFPWADKAVMSFLDTVNDNCFEIEDVVETMVRERTYPFSLLPKMVKWLN